MSTVDIDELEAKATAATGGPWHWAGNTDTGEPYLATWIKGAGRCQVLSIGYDERSTTGREADATRASLLDCGYDESDIEGMVDDWATDGFGQPMRDPRLEFMTDLMCVKARDLAVYEVAPQATSREDPEVYRADVVGIRHPDAEYVAAAHPAVVLALIAELRSERERADDATAALDARFEHSDHTAAKYYRRMREAEREMHARELHHFEEEQKSARLSAAIAEIQAAVGPNVIYAPDGDQDWGSEQDAYMEGAEHVLGTLRAILTRALNENGETDGQH